ncbi:DUF2799 domain-containing protein [Pontibacter sp. JAM-7]|uniref:DUF2799 domain-containing protein n=1 Tax=Pontibacter sp. JAM-7 TaxID=3366581 RepID=UPI003AF8878C
MQRFIAIWPMLLLVGCASLNQQQCEQAAWYRLGVSDGANGYPVSRLQSHQKACDKFSIDVVASDYAAGHQQGLLRYCTQASGFEVGWLNLPYYEVCTGEAEAAFLRGYLRGRNQAALYCWQRAFPGYGYGWGHHPYFAHSFFPSLFCD